MNCSFTQTKKAASKYAAFLFLGAALICVPAYSQKAKSAIENIRTKTAELLSVGKKDKAIGLLINFSKTERSKNHKAEVSELLFSVGQSFLNKEAQEYYEESINDTFDSERNSLKAAEKCLNIDEYNLDCRIQKARMLYRANKKNELKDALASVQALLLNSQYEEIFLSFLDREKPEFKTKNIIGMLPPAPNDKTYVYLLLELERAFKAKNYSRAKEILTYSEKHFADWPDIAYFRNKLNAESSEEASGSKDDLMTVYANRCKSISKTVARKYRYDFDLCLRGKNVKK